VINILRKIIFSTNQEHIWHNMALNRSAVLFFQLSGPRPVSSTLYSGLNMETIEIVIKTEQSCDMTYHLTCEELGELRNLIVHGGKKVIAGNSLEFDKGTLYHYKGGRAQGANYAMPIDGLLASIDEKLSTNCKC